MNNAQFRAVIKKALPYYIEAMAKMPDNRIDRVYMCSVLNAMSILNNMYEKRPFVYPLNVAKGVYEELYINSNDALTYWQVSSAIAKIMRYLTKAGNYRTLYFYLYRGVNKTNEPTKAELIQFWQGIVDSKTTL